MTMTLISTLSGGASTIVFSSIPQNYTDLRLVISARGTNGNVGDVSIRFNNDSTSSRYSTLLLIASSGSVVSGEGRGDTSRTFVGYIVGSVDGVAAYATNDVYIPDYTSTNAKRLSANSGAPNDNNTSQRSAIIAGFYNQGTAITQITILSSLTSFASGSSASLYGILKGAGGATVSLS
jgi:hypothetical protein